MYGTYGGPLPSTYGGPLPARYGGEGPDQLDPGVGRAVTYGGPLPGTYGGPLPSTYGDPYPVTEPARRDGYAITLFDADNNRQVIENVLSMSVNRPRSRVNSLTTTLPYADEELAEWRFSDVVLTYDGRALFNGQLREVDPDPVSSTTDLTVYGPAYKLDGDLEVRYQDIRVSDAIEDFWAEHTDFAATVTVRDGDVEDIPTIDDQEFSGTPLEILNDLHEFGGFDWYIDVSKPDLAYSFPRSRSVREPPFQIIGDGYQPSWDTTDYYNHVVVYGTGADGNRIKAEARAEDEIEEKGQMTWPEYTDIESQDDLKSRAETLLEEYLTNDERSGSIDMVPRSIDPGTALVVDEWDDERQIGPYSLYFDGADDVVIFQTGLEEQYSGAISLWVRAPFGATTHEPYIFSGRYDSSEPGAFRVVDSRRLSFRIGGESGIVGVDAYPEEEEPPHDEWTLLHYDWRYDAAGDRTTVRAGHDGTIMDEGGFPGRFEPPSFGFTLGRYNEDWFEGYVDDLRLYSQPQPEERYATLAERDEIPATDLISRWPFNEGPFRDTYEVVDIVGDNDGFRDRPEYRGDPLPVEQVQYSESMGEFSMTVDLAKTDSWALDLAEARSNIRSMNKR
ncbi:hypothetical protein JMJ58_14920 [Haloterrigena salifodinae]|uniref:Uncharacterized protein n=1 Tax=Haloterrigena salifodinae TaxID=2675099 RepID=A0A8T8DYH7_9EURY|nr:LamG-like jellyroll fold domain-containing protein [Haloterrigena salifodinae]QRV14226.1 hypothetical protein JMJ58_14920 [Haloterrigena salifodinae]